MCSAPRVWMGTPVPRPTIYATMAEAVADLPNDISVMIGGFGTGAPLNLLNAIRSEEHTSELQSLMRISYAVFCLKKKTPPNSTSHRTCTNTTNNTHTKTTR